MRKKSNFSIQGCDVLFTRTTTLTLLDQTLEFFDWSPTPLVATSLLFLVVFPS